MEALKAISLPLGFGFHPTDVELINHYLRRKNQGLKFNIEVIPELNIYKHEPWDLPSCCQIPTRDSKWHFFTSRATKYPKGLRTNRATEVGYWKSTGKDRNITSRNRVIGAKKTLVFHEGRPPYGKRTDWIMHEYSMDEKMIKTSSIMKNTYVLCRVTKRNGFAVEGENVSCQTEEIYDCQNTCNNLSQKDSIQSGSTENMDAWFEELFDPNFDGSFYFNVASLPAIESTNVPQVSQPSLGTLIPKNDPWNMLHHDFISMPKINESLKVDHNIIDTKDFKKEMFDLSNNTKFTSIQILDHVQASMMKSSNSVSVSQTIKFAHVDHHISTNNKSLQTINLKVQKKGGILAVIGSFLCLIDGNGCCFLSVCIFGFAALVIYFLFGDCLSS